MNLIDIAPLLREALLISGCTDQQIGSFDGHSTIELHLAGLPSINLGVVDSGLWFWSSLIEASDMLLAHRAEGLLRFLMEGVAFARTEQLQLVENDGMLEVRAMLADAAYADAEALSETVEEYLAALTRLSYLVRQ